MRTNAPRKWSCDVTPVQIEARVSNKRLRSVYGCLSCSLLRGPLLNIFDGAGIRLLKRFGTR